jgi:hypothetical protein
MSNSNDNNNNVNWSDIAPKTLYSDLVCAIQMVMDRSSMRRIAINKTTKDIHVDILPPNSNVIPSTYNEIAINIPDIYKNFNRGSSGTFKGYLIEEKDTFTLIGSIKADLLRRVMAVMLLASLFYNIYLFAPILLKIDFTNPLSDSVLMWGMSVCFILPVMYGLSAFLIKMAKLMADCPAKDLMSLLSRWDELSFNDYKISHHSSSERTEAVQNKFSGSELKIAFNLLFTMGVISSVSIIAYGYHYKLLGDKVLIGSYVLLPTRVFLCLALAMISTQLLYFWAGYGKLLNVFNIKFSMQISVKNCLEYLYLLESILIAPTGAYLITTHFLLVIIKLLK